MSAGFTLPLGLQPLLRRRSACLDLGIDAGLNFSTGLSFACVDKFTHVNRSNVVGLVVRRRRLQIDPRNARGKEALPCWIAWRKM